MQWGVCVEMWEQAGIDERCAKLVVSAEEGNGPVGGWVRARLALFEDSSEASLSLLSYILEDWIRECCWCLVSKWPQFATPLPLQPSSPIPSWSKGCYMPSVWLVTSTLPPTLVTVSHARPSLSQTAKLSMPSRLVAWLM